MKNKLIWFFVSITLLAMAAVIGFGTIGDSPTSDEPPHILSGYVFLRFGHDFIDPEHPLLVKSIASVPLLFTNLKIDLTDPNYSQQRYVTHIGKMFDHSRKFLAYQGNDPDQILFLTRLPMIGLTALFGLVIFLIARKLFGTFAASLALIFYVSEPNFLAHGSLVNTDIAAGGFIITIVLALLLYVERQSQKRLLFLILAVSFAVLSKFSTFYIVPLIIVLLFFFYRRRSLKLYNHLGILLLGVAATISVFYGLIGFRDSGFLAFVPARYIGGLIGSLVAVSSNERFSYLLGDSYTGSKVYYFPVLIALKTQLLTLLGVLLSVLFLFSKKLHLSKIELAVFFVPFLTFLFLALFAKFNIGVRHVLPVYPFLIILAGAGFAAFLRWASNFVPKNLKLSTIAFLVLVVVGLRVYSIGATYPHFLSYYNILAGGTDNGWKVADDSNYDWGQDVKRLAEFVRENKINSLAFDNYTGVYAAKDYYHLPVFQFSPDQTNYKGYLALSTSTITFHEDKPENYSWVVDNYEPIAKAGKSIFVYKLE